MEKKRRRSKDSESETDSDDSDLDLDKKLKPMASYVKQRGVLVEQMFHCISKKKLKRMLPEILKVFSAKYKALNVIDKFPTRKKFDLHHTSMKNHRRTVLVCVPVR